MLEYLGLSRYVYPFIPVRSLPCQTWQQSHLLISPCLVTFGAHSPGFDNRWLPLAIQAFIFANIAVSHLEEIAPASECILRRLVEHETAVPKVEYPKEWRVLMVDAEDDPCYPLLDTHLEAITFVSMHVLRSLFQHSWPLLSEG